MPFLTPEKVFSKKWFKNYALIVIGTFIMACGYVFFITPNRIVPGGVFGISIVIHYMTAGMFSRAPEGLPVGMMALLMNIPLVIIGIKVLGPRFGMKTIMGFVLTSVFIDVLTYFHGYKPLVEGDMLLSSIYGGILIGFGLGLIFKSKASSGGSDIVAMVISRYTRIPPGQLLIYIDSVIVLIGLAAFKDWQVPLYSWIVIFLTGRVIDTVMQGSNYDKALFIVSDRYEEIRSKIIVDLNRSATSIPARGMYKEQEKKMIFVNVNRREVAILQDYIREIDPEAFLTVINAYEILGKGFKPLKEEE
ncbi:MAG: YitT family protein [Bacteroidota bacterium]